MKRLIDLLIIFAIYMVAFVGGYFSAFWIDNLYLRILLWDVVSTVITFIFSLIFKKNFVVVPKQTANSRMQSLMKKANVEDRFIYPNQLTSLELTDLEVDYSNICDYLYESYGANFMKDYINALAKANYTYEETWGSLSEENMKEHANIFKKLFGKKVFESIATYYNKQAKQ